DRRARFDDAGTRAVGARLGEHSLEALLHPLARDDDQSEIRYLQRLRRRSILLQLQLDRLENFLPVLLLLHVDQVEDDDAAQIARGDLADALLPRFGVLLDARSLEPARRLLADVAPRVDVDRDERLGLVDDDRPAGLEPHFALEGLVDLGLHAVFVE